MQDKFLLTHKGSISLANIVNIGAFGAKATKTSCHRGSEAWSIGSVRASGAVGPEFEPTFCHSLLSGGPWQDLVSSVRLEPLTVYDVPIAPNTMISSKSASVPLRNQRKGDVGSSSTAAVTRKSSQMQASTKISVSTREMNTT